MSCMGATPLLALEDASGVAPLEEGAALESLDLEAVLLSAEPGTRSGEFAIVEVSDCIPFSFSPLLSSLPMGAAVVAPP